MKPFHIIGQPGSGKTTLMVDLISELVRQGIRVGSIKHSAHVHELDKPGKDSFCHRKAGASPVTMMAGDMAAIYLPLSRGNSKPTPQMFLENPLYQNLDMVLIEGWISGPYPKIEMWRKEAGRPPLFTKVEGVRALVTDDSLDPDSSSEAKSAGLRLFQRKSPRDIVAYLLE
ncbi:molybdopterin-guanine dinucleotide biosynthesis protein B [Desulfospira joergensenii]|uniref:molybdopterin-guanine dinucleotide biosynthesis protein B n=1 Tax=Desulfospira joergensenii TaxID=53329 RepID=UPI0003B46018|nr:molybdopterin-guanine dinucleotide biosynthesis protein B [Desulfospira joergensenii]